LTNIYASLEEFISNSCTVNIHYSNSLTAANKALVIITLFFKMKCVELLYCSKFKWI